MNNHLCAIPAYPINFFDDRKKTIGSLTHMLKRMNEPNFIYGVGCPRPWSYFQVKNNIGSRGLKLIHVQKAGLLFAAATKIEFHVNAFLWWLDCH